MRENPNAFLENMKKREQMKYRKIDIDRQGNITMLDSEDSEDEEEVLSEKSEEQDEGMNSVGLFNTARCIVF